MGPLIQCSELQNILNTKYGKGLYHHARNYNFLVAVDEESHEYMFDVEKLRQHLRKLMNRHAKITARILRFKKYIKEIPFNIWYPWPIDCINGRFFKKKEDLKSYKIWVDINLYAHLMNANPLNTRNCQTTFKKIGVLLKEANIPQCPFPYTNKIKRVADTEVLLKKERSYKSGYFRLLKKLEEYTDELW